MVAWGMEEKFQTATMRKIFDASSIAANCRTLQHGSLVQQMAHCKGTKSLFDLAMERKNLFTTLAKKSEFGTQKLLTQTVSERRDYFNTNRDKLILNRVEKEYQSMLAYSQELAKQAKLLQDIAAQHRLDPSSQQELERIQIGQQNVQAYINQLMERIGLIHREIQQDRHQYTQSVKDAPLDRLIDVMQDLITTKNALIKKFNHQSSLPGFTPMALAKLEVELEHSLERLDIHLAITDQIFREKVQNLSIEQLIALQSRLKENATKLNDQIRLCKSRNVESVVHEQALEQIQNEQKFIQAYRDQLQQKNSSHAPVACKPAVSSTNQNQIPQKSSPSFVGIAQKIGDYVGPVITAGIGTTQTLSMAGGAAATCAAAVGATEAVRGISQLLGIAAAASHKKHDALADFQEQMLEEQRAKQQQPKPEEQTAKNIDPGVLQDGIFQANSPAVTLNDQLEMAPTARTAMPDAARQDENVTTATTSSISSLATNSRVDVQENIAVASVPTPSSATFSTKRDTIAQSEKSAAILTPVLAGNNPVPATVAAVGQVRGQDKTPEDFENFVDKSAKAEAGVHQNPRNALANTAKYLTEQEKAAEAAKHKQERFVYVDGSSTTLIPGKQYPIYSSDQSFRGYVPPAQLQSVAAVQQPTLAIATGKRFAGFYVTAVDPSKPIYYKAIVDTQTAPEGWTLISTTNPIRIQFNTDLKLQFRQANDQGATTLVFGQKDAPGKTIALYVDAPYKSGVRVQPEAFVNMPRVWGLAANNNISIAELAASMNQPEPKSGAQVTNQAPSLPAPAIAIGNVLPPTVAKSQANDNGDSEGASGKQQPIPAMPMGPDQKPPKDDEEEKQCDKDAKGVIKKYFKRAMDRTHIFSEPHIKDGIMKLTSLATASEEVQKDDIIEKFKAIVTAVDAKGLLKDGVTNAIQMVINGLKVQIQVHIINGEVMSLDGYIGHSARIWPNMVKWPQ